MMHLPTLVTKNRNIMSPSIGWLSLVLTVSSVVASRGSHASTHTERGSQWPMKGKRLRGNRAYQIMLPAEQSHHYDAELRVSSIETQKRLLKAGKIAKAKKIQKAVKSQKAEKSKIKKGKPKTTKNSQKKDKKGGGPKSLELKSKANPYDLSSQNGNGAGKGGSSGHSKPSTTAGDDDDYNAKNNRGGNGGNGVTSAGNNNDDDQLNGNSKTGTGVSINNDDDKVIAPSNSTGQLGLNGTKTTPVTSANSTNSGTSNSTKNGNTTVITTNNTATTNSGNTTNITVDSPLCAFSSSCTSSNATGKSNTTSGKTGKTGNGGTNSSSPAAEARTFRSKKWWLLVMGAAILAACLSICLACRQCVKHKKPAETGVVVLGNDEEDDPTTSYVLASDDAADAGPTASCFPSLFSPKEVAHSNYVAADDDYSSTSTDESSEGGEENDNELDESKVHYSRHGDGDDDNTSASSEVWNPRWPEGQIKSDEGRGASLNDAVSARSKGSYRSKNERETTDTRNQSTADDSLRSNDYKSTVAIERHLERLNQSSGNVSFDEHDMSAADTSTATEIASNKARGTSRPVVTKGIVESMRRIFVPVKDVANAPDEPSAPSCPQSEGKSSDCPSDEDSRKSLTSKTF